jgi:hypothetical protein
MINRVKLEQAATGLTRGFRNSLLIAVALTIVAVGDGAAAVLDGRPSVIVLDVFLFFVAAIQWSDCRGVYLMRRTLTVILESLEDAPQDNGNKPAA